MEDILYKNSPSDVRIREMVSITVNQKKHDYSKDYLTFEALEDGTFTLTIPADVNSTYMTSISYSTDNGKTWNTTTIDNTAQTVTTPTITSGNKVLWKGVGKQMAKLFSVYSYFSSTGNFNVSGNIMSLLYGDEFANQEALPSDSMYNFCNLFRVNKLTSARNLILPTITLVDSCYREMFQGCTSLVTAPELPATTLANSCYNYMFRGCTSLTTAPELPAITVADYCYNGMFWNCTSLNTTPLLPATTLANNCYLDMFRDCVSLKLASKLPATELADNCYYRMFQNCTSLISAPELPAATLTPYCYENMFYGCVKLNYIKAMFTTTPGNTYTKNWVSGVASTGTFVKNSAATWNETGVNGIPSGWTVETADS